MKARRDRSGQDLHYSLIAPTRRQKELLTYVLAFIVGTSSIVVVYSRLLLWEYDRVVVMLNPLKH